MYIERDEERNNSITSSADKTSSVDQDIAWYPQSKINIVKRKLNKGNPASKLPWHWKTTDTKQTKLKQASLSLN